jgi:hypothetical protein
MERKHDRSFERAESEISRALAGAGRDGPAIAAAVASVLARDLRRADRAGAALLSAISALAFAAAHAAEETGGEIGRVAQGFMLGAMLAGRAEESRLSALIGHAAGTFVKHVHEAGGDVAAAGRGLVEGAVFGSGKVGIDAETAADAAGRGAAAGADDVDPRLACRVRAAMEAPIAGLRVHLEERVEAS